MNTKKLIEIAESIISNNDTFWDDNLHDYGYHGNIIPQDELNFLKKNLIDLGFEF